MPLGIIKRPNSIPNMGVPFPRPQNSPVTNLYSRHSPSNQSDVVDLMIRLWFGSQLVSLDVYTPSFGVKPLGRPPGHLRLCPSGFRTSPTESFQDPDFFVLCSLLVLQMLSDLAPSVRDCPRPLYLLDLLLLTDLLR